MGATSEVGVSDLVDVLYFYGAHVTTLLPPVPLDACVLYEHSPGGQVGHVMHVVIS